jgi:hypothetical protein
MSQINLALGVILDATDLTAEQCTSLLRKVAEVERERRYCESLEQLQKNCVDLEAVLWKWTSSKLFDRLKTPMSGWSLAWQIRAVREKGGDLPPHLQARRLSSSMLV